MKSFNSVRGLLLLLLCSTSFTFVSCDKDDDEPNIPSNAKEILGQYDANIVSEKSKNNVGVEIGKTFVIDKFPTSIIVSSIVAKDDSLAALKSLKDITYAMEYTAKVVDKKINMTLYPKTLLFDITVKNKTQKVMVSFNSTATATYDMTNKSLTSTLSAKSVSVDGKNITTFKTMDFQLTATKKK